MQNKPLPMNSIGNQNIKGPTTERERYVILDALRGMALLGIAMANFPEFALWTFLSPEEQAAMPTAGVDKVVKFLQYLLIDGKFYSIFSILFGIGFSHSGPPQRVTLPEAYGDSCCDRTMSHDVSVER